MILNSLELLTENPATLVVGGSGENYKLLEMVTKKENKYMSRWTHVAAIFRIDSIGQISDDEITEKFGREVDWEEMANCDYDDSDEWVQQEFLPMGSEGSLTMSIWHNPVKNEMSSTTVSVFGDLRDYGGSDDIERLEQWFAKCCENNWTRQAVMQVIDEYCDKPTIFQYIQN